MLPLDSISATRQRASTAGRIGTHEYCYLPAVEFDELDEPTEPGARTRDRWRLNLLGVLLAGLLGGSLVLSSVLWFELGRVRAQLEQSEAAPPERDGAPPPAPAAQTVRAAAPAEEPAPAAEPAPQGKPAPQRLIILLTVGTRHFAEKQVGILRRHCKAPLAVYLQRRGRCAFSQCFAVAALESDASLALDCGKTRGETIRDSSDFMQLQ